MAYSNQEKKIKDNSSDEKVKYFLMIPLEQENFISTFDLCDYINLIKYLRI